MTPAIASPNPEPLYPPIAEPTYSVSFPKNLPSSDGQPMDSPWHRAQIELLINVLRTAWSGRDFFCGGNMCVYFSEQQIRNKEFLGPDFFVVLNVDPNRPREYWATWEQNGRYPDIIVELMSPTTADRDLTTKKNLYENTFHTPEYFCFDRDDGFKLHGWRLGAQSYEPIRQQDGRMWSERLEMSLGSWTGQFDGQESTWLRFFDREGHMLPTHGEKEAARADKEAARADREAAKYQNEADIVRKLKMELEALRDQMNKPSS